MKPNPKKLAAVGVGVVGLAMVGNHFVSDDVADDQVRVTAVFSDASPLVAGNVVKAAGVQVGSITDIDLENGKAEVEMVLDRSVLPLHEDVTATITTQDLLGERFIALDRGSPDSPELEDPMVISQKHTARVVDLQDVLGSLDTPTSAALAALVTESGEALKGQGEQTDAAIAALGPAMTQSRDLAAILSGQNELLGQLVDNVQPVASALGTEKGRSLDHLVSSTTDALGIVAAERETLQSALERLPGTISSSRAALAELAGVADPATRTLGSLRPVTDDLVDISGELQRFADAADPALASLPPVLKKADELLAQAGPVAAALRPTARDLVPTSAAAERLTTGAVSGQHLTDLLEFVKGWSMATSDYDAISHYFKAMVPLSPNALGDTAAGLVPALPDDILHGLPVPAAPEVPLPGRPGAPKNTAPPTSDSAPPSTEKSATGLSQPQENALLEQLLGGLK
ncbi:MULTISPECIES: MlaD family protein [unclassified Nocardioides]|uniref:MlaD family protein n=1 Tax=unclassified Nocardioides TaxID=2615069 RepID=UPI0006F595A8|nr:MULTISPECIES: MlaD family protein [unclassified Nocardioides]KQY57228.1 mammalian cell entry protein [Nocardioides sp. Root140]KQZ68743.1 mammalian cell entry protein [Nocardioides sp. Root151]KRF11872.1 mammalian cell entry protein [Nocardioides sp. Soil796]